MAVGLTEGLFRVSLPHMWCSETRMESPFPLLSLSIAEVSAGVWEGDEKLSLFSYILLMMGLSPALQEAFLERPRCRVTSF